MYFEISVVVIADFYHGLILKHYELQYPNRSSIIFNFKTMAYFNQLYFMFYYGNAMWDNTPKFLNIRKIHQHPTEYHLFIYSLQTNYLINT